MNVKNAFLFFLLILIPGCSCADKNRSQESKKNNASSLVVINVLDKELFSDCHIKGSVSVPFMDEEDPEKSPIESFVKDLPKETKLVIYCSNYMCSASGEIAKKLKSMGFVNVWAYEAGLAEWYQKGLPVVGSCKQAYLSRVVSPTKDHHSNDFQVITTEDLKRMMEELL